ncbi:hypothetical protein [Sphingomonas montanisoli]|uniref:Uncharacterized protein n=1 Tax=Sphingomonas montanisoli TaxID=2606412 RepID=A0A5D9C8Y9_9SPHN|nr:hypothetical protein [Sphingomonas montanisoli]TZG27846.1 hypothetical protein FYJ91_09830 [Sphingomonas montanisoli]
MTVRQLAPIRFLWIIVGGWCAMRAVFGLLSGLPVTAKVETPARSARVVRQVLAAVAPVAIAPIMLSDSTPPSGRTVQPGERRRPRAVTATLPSDFAQFARIEADAAEAPPVPTLPLPPLPATASTGRRWHGSAWLFARRGGDVDLARFGQLGGSQAGARIAWRVDGSGRIPISIAARAYTPLRTRNGAEGAVGVEIEPLRHAALRLSVERRFRITRGGRNAWAAYAAGGLYREFGADIVADAYAQAGMVGAQRRDLFADGAVRAGRHVRIDHKRAIIVGAGAWGAAQPGVSRLDVGPRIALALPVDRATVTLASEYRIRVAGDARPGSGLALTLSTDF